MLSIIDKVPIAILLSASGNGNMQSFFFFFFFCFMKDFCLAFYDQVSLEKHHELLPWNSTICIFQIYLVLENVWYLKMLFFSFLLQIQKFFINLNRKKRKGKQTETTTTNKNSPNKTHTTSNSPEIQKLALLRDNFNYKCIWYNNKTYIYPLPK